MDRDFVIQLGVPRLVHLLLNARAGAAPLSAGNDWISFGRDISGPVLGASGDSMLILDGVSVSRER